jgi:hypothetical protein
MASAVLMLLDPTRYGVIDIRVWQLLHELGAVTKNANGVGFTFQNWYQFLVLIRHFSKKLFVSFRFLINHPYLTKLREALPVNAPTHKE